MAADLAISLVTPFLEYLIRPVGRQCGYILFYKRYLKELEVGVDKLKDELQDVEHRCEAARRNAMDVEAKAETWLRGVTDVVKEADSILRNRNTVITENDCPSRFNRCVGLNHQPSRDGAADTIIENDDDEVLASRKKRFYLNPVTCYRKGRKAKKTMLTVQELNEEKKNLGNISYESTIEPLLSTKDYKSFASRSGIVKDIMKALGDVNISVIGVWGMGGVGKSTMMKEIMRLSKEEHLFNDVAIATVSENPDIKKIQGELSVWLGLKLKDDESVRERASRLHKRLNKSTAEPLEINKDGAVKMPEEKQAVNLFERPFWLYPKSNNKNDSKSLTTHVIQDQIQVGEMEKKSNEVLEGNDNVKQKQVLVILDDLWGPLDLEDIGIPQDAGAIKLLLTSRNQHVLSSEMGCYRNVFEVKVLNEDESWTLFESIVREKERLDDKLIPIGKEVVKKCSGLPVVLKAIATTLKNCSLPEWEEALVEVKGSKDAYSNLEISYKHLESEELKSLFLVCALIKQGRIPQKDIFYYSMGLGLLKGTNTIRNAKKKVNALLHNLQDSSLLQKDEIYPDYVRIHDIVREVALTIASRDKYGFMITHMSELKQITKNKVKNSKVISIPYVNFRKLPGGWKCLELEMLLVYRGKNDAHIDVAESYFEGMRELKVLDFTGMCLHPFPSSIQVLENLYTLCLDRCIIQDLTIIGELKQLQILTFRGSEIAKLPKEIGELSELKVLNLSRSRLELIEPRVLGRLTSLEELHMKGSSFKEWEDEEEIRPTTSKLSELNNMRNLSCINLHIRDPSKIPKQLELQNLVEYIIQIGDVWNWSGDFKASRTLKIKLEFSRNNMLSEKWTQDLLKSTQDLQVDGLEGRRKSFHELCLDGFQELKHLYLQNSSSIQFVTHTIYECFPCTAFPVLESLFLENLTGLEMISRGPVVPASFRKLKVIKVISCGKLEHLFSYSMLKVISQLEEIEVRDCEAMKKIVIVDSDDTDIETIRLEALHRIKLHELPNLTSFYSRHEVEVDHCIPTNTLFLNEQEVSLPLLKSLILSSLPKLKYIWQNNCPIEVTNLEYLKVSSCNDLSIVIPSSLVEKVKNLKTLMVKDCRSVKQLFESSDVLNLTRNVEFLSRLSKLELSDLPCLTHIWENNYELHQNVTVFQNLNLVKVENCNSLKNFLHVDVLKGLGQITSICIRSCEKMEEVVIADSDGKAEKTTNILFQSLVDVLLEDLPNMVTFVRTNRGESINFPALQNLYVQKCPNMRAFCLLKGKEDSDVSQLCFFDEKVLLPSLAKLFLISLGSIHKIWLEEILEQSFSQLEKLGVRDCQNLVSVIPFIKVTGRVQQLHNLKTIIVSQCTSLVGPIFKFAEEEKENGRRKGCVLPQLETLLLVDLPKLEHVIQPTSHVIIGFPSLVEVTVSDCQSIVDLFPIATTTTLSKLKSLIARRCGSMKHVFGKEDGQEEDKMLNSILFPCLRYLTLDDLGSLICFFLGAICVIDFPSLEEIRISFCMNLKTFVQWHTSDQTLEEHTTSINEGTHYLFDDKILLPKLVRLELDSTASIEKIWQEEIPQESFSQLENLIIKDCHNLVDVFPTNLVGIRGFQFQNLKEIIVRECMSLEGSLFKFGGEEKGKGCKKGYLLLPQLEKLWLYDLPQLTHVLDPTSHVVLGFPKLVYISIADNQSFIDLFPISTAPSLKNLEKLDIFRCGSMRQVFRKHEVEEEEDLIDRILFPCLRSIQVQNLDSLISFFLETNSVLEFPSLEELDISWCRELKAFAQRHTTEKLEEFANEDVRYLFDDKVSLPLLKSLILSSLPKLKYIWQNNCPIEVTNLEYLKVSSCNDLSIVIPSSLVEKVKNLKTLMVKDCRSVKQLFESSDVLNLTRNVEFLSRLSKLELSDLPCLTHIWENNYELHQNVTVFQNLNLVKVENCNSLKNFLHVDVLKGLGQITSICIRSCEKMEEVVIADSDGKAEKTTNILFQSLVDVLLEDLPNMVTFVRTNRGESINFPALQNLYVQKCPNMRAFCLLKGKEDSDVSQLCFFDEKVLLPSLAKLFLISLGSIHKIWLEEILEQSFSQLEKLGVRDCQNLVSVIPFIKVTGRVQQLHNLKTIIVSQCTSLVGPIFKFAEEEKENGRRKGCVLPQLETLLLVDLPKLEHVIQPTSHVIIGFPSLVEVTVSDCQSIVDLFPIATTTTLSKLKSLIARRCGSMKHVFGKEDGQEEDKMLNSILFPCLRYLTLDDLGSLICFFLGAICVIDFPSLEEIRISFCMNLKTFVQWHTSDQTLEEHTTSINEGTHYLFDDKILLPKLVRLELDSTASIEKIWQEEIPQESFSQLENLIIKDCHNLVDVFPTNLVGIRGFQFQNLKEIIVRECMSLEGSLFKFGGEEKGKGCKKGYLLLPQLEKLWLYDLPQLTHVLDPTSHVVLGFPKLVYISIADNQSFIDLFPISTAPSLKNLEKLDIFRCGSMRQVFRKHEVEEEEDLIDRILFPCLRSVQVQNLDSLISFFLETNSVLEFPSLEELDISWCRELKAFAQRHTTEKLEEFANEDVCYLFDDKILLPKLVRLTLISTGRIEKIWQEEIPQQSFSQLENLIIKECHNLVDVFPTNLVGIRGFQFQNLKEIIVHECMSLEGSLFKFGGEEKGKGCKKGYLLLPQLEKLWLDHLPQLTHVLDPTSHVVLGFPKLVYISIADNQSFIDLFPISTAASLKNLEKLVILRCGSMRQVFRKHEVEEEEDLIDRILFPCLRSIQVQNLDSLISFFLETNSVLEFPSLEELDISWCRELKAFAQRHTTEKLEEFANEDFRYLFDDKVVLPNLQKMKLCKLSSLQTIWKNYLLLSSDSCSKLKALTVRDCEDLQHIFPATLASNLLQLEELNVHTSTVVEIVKLDIDDDRSREADEKSPDQLFFFPQLTSLTLDDLPNLRRFFRGSNACTWPALKKLFMWNCGKVRMFTSKVSSNNSENTSTRQTLFSAEQVIPFLERMSLAEEDVIMFQNGAFQDDIFSSLKALCLSHFHGARSDFPSRFLLEKFQKLERLTIFDSSLEEIFPNESLSPEEITSYKRSFAGEGKERPFASLRELKFNKLHNLKQVWKAGTIMAKILEGVQSLEVRKCPSLTTLFPTASASFGNVTKLEVRNCNGLKELMTASAATSLLKLTQMDIYGCEMIEEIVAGDEECKSEDSSSIFSFPELRHLGFHRLRSLTSFSSTNCAFEFLSLEKVIVMECPNMNTFSHSSVVAPKLSKVTLKKEKTKDEEFWNGDINTTIQNLFSK